MSRGVLGLNGSLRHTFAQEDFDRFARISGDANPIHVDPAFSSRTRFGRTVAHGLLISTVLRGLIDRLLPGGRQVDQQLMFPAPTYAGDPMRYHARVLACSEGQATVEFQVTRVDDGEVTCQGRCRVAFQEDTT